MEDRNAATICAAARLVPIDLLLVNDMAGVYPARRRNVPAQPHWNHFRVSSSHPPAGCPLLGMSAISITFVRFWPNVRVRWFAPSVALHPRSGRLHPRSIVLHVGSPHGVSQRAPATHKCRDTAVGSPPGDPRRGPRNRPLGTRAGRGMEVRTYPEPEPQSGRGRFRFAQARQGPAGFATEPGPNVPLLRRPWARAHELALARHCIPQSLPRSVRRRTDY